MYLHLCSEVRHFLGGIIQSERLKRNLRNSMQE
nr:MAG TPA: hypothetical protein [Caudoviricetes sp.]